MFKKLHLIKSPRDFLGWIMYLLCPDCMSERLYLEMNYLFTKREHLNLNNPITFNEKIQWLKLYDRNPLYTLLVDKYRVKEWVKNRIGGEYVIPLLNKYDTPEDIILDSLPNQFVLKCNHDSGSVIICRDKSSFNLQEARQQLKQHLETDPSGPYCEWAYLNVPRCIIAEPLLIDKENEHLTDYKFFCFDGAPRIMYISQDHSENTTTDFFDMDFNHLPIRMQAPPSIVLPKKPEQFEKMKELASNLAKGIPQVRVDFYIVNGHIYFGEMTFYHCGGMIKVQPEEWNIKMGNMISLPPRRSNNEKTKRLNSN